MNKKYLLLTFLLGMVMLAIADREITGLQASRFLTRVSSEEVFETLTAQISIGMSRKQVEEILAGYRSAEVTPRDDGYLVSYGYWFGFLPPWGLYRLKFWGEIEVRYSPQGKVTKASYWYN